MPTESTKLLLIKEVEIIFDHINSKIDSLTQCSSEDFTKISHSFKNFFSEIQKVSSNTKDIFEYVGENNINTFQVSLNDTLEKGKDLFIILDKIFPFFISIHKKHPFANNDFFIHYNNIRQYLNTLKLFLAKYRLTECADNSNNINSAIINAISNLEDDSNNFQHIINLEIENLRKVFKDLQSIIKSTEFSEISQRKFSQSDVDDILAYFNNKHKTANLQIPTLNEKISIVNESFSNIITNLQYHDIIRQRIEHIQFAHKQAFDDLKNFRIKQEFQQEENTDSIGHIAEIADLQAAHLLNANREYQSAIKIIIEKLNGLSDIVKTTSELSSLFIDHDDTYYYITAKKVAQCTNLILESTENIKMCENLSQLIEKMFTIISTLIDKTRDFKLSFNKNIQILIDQSIRKSPHIDNLKIEIISNIQNIEDYLSSTLQLISNSENSTIIDILKIQLPQAKTDFSNTFSGFQQSCIDINDEIKLKISENKILSHRTVLDIQRSIKGVTFYDYFEQIVGETISSLDEIGNKLITLGISSKGDSQKLELIKQMYTMASERQTHCQTLHTDFSEVIDDDIEFF